ncbi:hypothetical protein BOX15_Mlig007474g1, partial [Macrostomum lignano]
ETMQQVRPQSEHSDTDNSTVPIINGGTNTAMETDDSEPAAEEKSTDDFESVDLESTLCSGDIRQAAEQSAPVQRSFSSVSSKRTSTATLIAASHQRSSSDLHGVLLQQQQSTSGTPNHQAGSSGVLLNPAGIQHCSSFSSLSSLVSASTELSLPEGDRISLQQFDSASSSAAAAIGGSPTRRQQLQLQSQQQQQQQSNLLNKLFGWREKWSPSSSISSDGRQVSTLGLIAVDRPTGAPPKDLSELARHQREYQEMLRNAQRKEEDDRLRRRKDSDKNRRLENQAQKLMDTWQNKVLPNWQEFTSREAKKFRDLCWHGVPSNARPQVWFRLLGNELRITEELFDIHVSRARDMAEKQQLKPSSASSSANSTDIVERTAEMNSLKLISLDVSRTLPDIKLFQRGGPYHDRLFDLLAAYASFSPDTGYVQGMSFICAVLLLNCSSDYHAFVSFANLLSRPCLRAHYRFDERCMRAYELTFEALLCENLPRLAKHFELHEFHMRPILTDWVFTIFAKNLQYDVACRIWDMFVHDGDAFLYRASLGILRLYESQLLTMDYSQMMELLKNPLPDLDIESLFDNVKAVSMRLVNRSDRLEFAELFDQCVQDLNSDRVSLSS